MKILPSKEQFLPIMLVSALTVAIVMRVGAIRKVVVGA
jgi:hypothetical protein